ncbi:GlsB/YeaQ/YmgE family stress response membrane protein [Chachezhania sediminis]|uniref:GlsB/YeaQ/YmgE family stress response membrane protein n=1 Tax=Chachezhania sediminis TaxID=2599291 RepID=UPI002D7E85AF|nr:GlsB/YeaQ/YmgE family stress response membrane protein [Chachezhania sediminis]
MMWLLWWIIVGGAAGFIATRLLDLQTGPVATVAIGIGGALVGGFVLKVALSFLGLFAGILGAVLGAIALIWLWQVVAGR